MAGVFFAVELGGTKCLVTSRADDQARRAPTRLTTQGPRETLDSIYRDLERRSREEGAPDAIGVASFGPLELDPTSERWGHLLTTPKPGWSGTDLAGALQRRFGAPVTVQTDVNAAALAEGAHGAARGAATHAYVTIGTGVGVGAVVAGAPLVGAGHPEGGHLRLRRLSADASPGFCPWHGDCVEGLISGPALQARTGTPAEALPAGHPVWAFAGEVLGELLLSIVYMLAPERIVIGGGVGSRPELLAAAREGLIALNNGYVERLTARGAAEALVVAAELQNAGLTGALDLAEAVVIKARAGPSQPKAQSLSAPSPPSGRSPA